MLLRAASALLYVERRGLMVVFSDEVKKVWKRWEVQALIVFSLILQVVLIGLGHRRKYMGSRAWTRFLIWSAYLLADWVATVALGVISQNTLDDCKKHGDGEDPMDELMSFWAPFLLLHLGGPDTITAYALEDNELWLRHLVGLVIQTGSAFYVLLVAWPGASWLPALSLPIFMAGLAKYGERTLALKSANIENLRDSMLPPPDSGPNYPRFMAERTLRKAEGYHVEAAEVKELPVPIAHSGKLVSEAYEQFQTFKRLFVDLILSFQDKESSQSYFQTLEPDRAFEVVEVELGFAFDLFYTKAPVVHTVAGCIVRVLTFSCTCSALIALPFLCEESKYHKIDLVITYLLLVVAILLEIYAVMTQINSDWTVYWLHKPKKTQENMSIGHSHQGNKEGWRNKTQENMISGLRHQQNKQRWSNRTAQYNLLSFCLEEKPPTFYTFQKLFQIAQVREKHRYKTYKNVSTGLKSLIFNEFKKSIETNEADLKGLGNQRGSFAFKKHLPDWKKDIEFDQRILIWHIATDICFYLDEDEEHPGDVSAIREESKQLSDYMLYLLVLHPFTLPIGIGIIRFRDTCAEAKEFFHERGHKKVIACKKLLQVNTEVSPVKVKGDRSKSVLFDACRLAKSLRQTEDKDSRWQTISREWVEILAYAASHSRGNHHAQQLRKGGELLTHVWLLMAHLGITEQFQINQGHARAKLVTK